MGLTPITFTELINFSLSLNLNLTPWESQQLIIMSREYCGMINAAKKLDCPCPWHPEGYSDLAMAREKVVRNGMKLRQVINNKAS